MGYLHIPNLYKEQVILLFKECYALEKIHGTSAHVRLQWDNPDGSDDKVQVHYFSGGTTHATFVSLFDEAALIKHFIEMGLPRDRSLIFFGESYGAKEQGMSGTYGKVAKFVVFDVKIGESWLDVPDAEKVAHDYGLEFVYYRKVPTTLEALDAERDAPSEQAIRNGISSRVVGSDLLSGALSYRELIVNPKPREGVVLRPLKEMRLNNGNRVIVKHKREEFRETAKPRDAATDPAKLERLAEAEAVANEWVTPMRLSHVLDKIPNHDISMMPKILGAMVEDVTREAGTEIDWSKDERGIKKAITSRTARLYKELMQNNLRNPKVED